MADPLSGARLKLARAEEHFGELRAAHQRFLNRNPYRALREADVELHHYLWRIKVVEHPPLDHWAALVGDCVHALRSALDHTAYVLVNRKQFVTEKTAFPILDDPSKWDSCHPKDLPGIDPKALTLVESMQPYNTGDEESPLWRVHMLDIIDKHRRLPLVTSMLHATAWGAEGGEVHITDPSLGPFEDGAVVGRFKIVAEEGSQVNMKTEFAFGIAFGEGIPASGEEIFGSLELWRVFIGGMIARFEAFL